jgi:hypothetical protein
VVASQRGIFTVSEGSRALIAQGGGEQDQEFAGDRRERHLGGLARGAQPLIKRAAHGIVSSGDQDPLCLLPVLLSAREEPDIPLGLSSP